MKNKVGSHNKISMILALYFIMVIVFLKAQFQSAFQSPSISKKYLLNQNKMMNKRVILLVVDASKYQYISEMLPQTNTTNSLTMKCQVSQPTMTTQKIQTLMTGSQVFSTSSIMDSFFTNSVSTDNLIKQLSLNSQQVVAMGDDTWGKMFPIQKQYPCINTFDIYDWYGCDKIIYEHLEQQIDIKSNKLIIAHFLVLDHIGHSTSSTSDANMNIMKYKLKYKLQQQDILMITGDHGMRDDGNHGGSSQSQIQTFFYVYSSKYNINKLISQQQLIRQPDITATISILLDIPIPTNSIGIPIFTIMDPVVTTATKSTYYQQQYQQIVENSINHFRDIINFSEIDCSQLLAILDDDKNNNNNIFNKQQRFKYLRSIQQNCLNKLSHSQPNPTLVIISISTMFILCIILLYKHTTSPFITTNTTYYIHTVILLTLIILHPFSWLLIKNSSTYYTIILIISISLNIQFKFYNKIIMILSVLLFNQLQHSKPGQYEQNMFYIQYIGELIQRWAFVIALFLYIFIIYYLFVYRNNSSYNNNSNSNNNQTIPQPLPLIFAIASNFLKILSQIDNKIINKNLIVSINIITTITLIIYLVLFSIILKKKKSNNISIVMCVCVLLGLFNGNGLLYLLTIVLYYIIIIKYNNNTNNNNTNTIGYLLFLLSQYTWWIYGNGYQYSSFDIKQSYVYSTNYHYLLNPICLIINAMTPYILTLVLYYNLSNNNNNNSSGYQNQTIYAQKIQQSEQQQYQQQQQQQLSENRRLPIVIYQQLNHTMLVFSQFMILPMIWLIFACINLVYNNGKILFTVVYVPMVIIQTGRIFVMLTAILIYNLLRS